LDIFYSSATRAAKQNPISQEAIIFSDGVAGSPKTFASNFLSAPTAVAEPLSPPTNPADALLTQAYLGLKTHPETVALFGTATPA
jgi:hypothetical protein